MITPLRSVNLVSPNIKSYIENRRKYLTCNPDYFIRSDSRAENKLEEEVNRHSINIELVDFNLTRSDSLKLKAKERRRSAHHLREAREWAKKNLMFPLHRDYIAQVGTLIDPKANPRGYRDDDVRIKGSRAVCPSIDKMDREMTIFLWENESLKDPLEKALHAHFSIGRVHPFRDGNGRTARLIQDVILLDMKLPLAMIPLYERPEYIQKIEDAAVSYNEKEGSFSGEIDKQLLDLRDLATRPRDLTPEELAEAKLLAQNVLSYRITPEQNAFYDFIALRVLGGLSEELKRLYPSDKEMVAYLKKKNGSKKFERYSKDSIEAIKTQNRRAVYSSKFQSSMPHNL